VARGNPTPNPEPSTMNPETLNPDTADLDPIPIKKTQHCPSEVRECVDYKNSMITDEDPLRGLLFY